MVKEIKEICELTHPSSDKKNTLVGKLYIPTGEIKAFVHIVHGMTEHIGRYHKFMSELCEQGYACFAFDNLGHGKTAKDQSELGFIASKRGYAKLCADVYSFGNFVHKYYAQKAPYILLGHSMGSFIARSTAIIFPIPDKLIIMGTGGKNPLTDIGLFILKLNRLIFGEKHISPFAESLAFGQYNKKFGNDNKYNWLSVNEENKKIYAQDKFCTFHFTVSALIDLITLNKIANSEKWFRKIRRDMPILLISGAEDPVGDYSNGVKWVYENLKNVGADVDIKLYKGYRHEILNDDCYGDVKKDIISFIKQKKVK